MHSKSIVHLDLKVRNSNSIRRTKLARFDTLYADDLVSTIKFVLLFVTTVDKKLSHLPNQELFVWNY